jgi:hypothetical protein
MKTIIAIIQTLFILSCNVLLVICAYFIFHYGILYRNMQKYQENALKQEIKYRDSLAGQVRIINEQERIIKSICKTPPVMQTESYKRGKRKQDSIKQLKTND